MDHLCRQLCLIMGTAGPLCCILPINFCPLCLANSVLRSSFPKASAVFTSAIHRWCFHSLASEQIALSPGRVGRTCCSSGGSRSCLWAAMQQKMICEPLEVTDTLGWRWGDSLLWAGCTQQAVCKEQQRAWQILCSRSAAKMWMRGNGLPRGDAWGPQRHCNHSVAHSLDCRQALCGGMEV